MENKIPEKDAKLLWGKGAALCSMEDCRVLLVAKASKAIPSQHVLLGECCHIVADKKGGPRGVNSMPMKERKHYPNLILLCRPHHKIIDTDPKEWSVKRLHKIKSAHEKWVAEKFVPEMSLAGQFYRARVDEVTDGFWLKKWNSISDHALRGSIPDAVVTGINRFGDNIFKANWPGEKVGLEKAMKNLARRSNDFLTHYMTRAESRHSGTTWWWVEDKSWKNSGLMPEARWKEEKLAGVWRDESAALLRNLVVALNAFAKAVRDHLLPGYFFARGNFTIVDALGLTNEEHPVHYLPKTYVSVNWPRKKKK